MKGTFGGPNVPLLVDLTYNDAKFGLIDDPNNLKDDKVFIYSGRTPVLGAHRFLLLSDFIVSNPFLLLTLIRFLRHGDNSRSGAVAAGLLLLLHGRPAHLHLLRSPGRALPAHAQLRGGLPDPQLALPGRLSL